MRVLVADDDPVSRLAVRSVLEANGFEVVEAESGRQAWELLSAEDGPGLAVLDWMMPPPDGMEICRRLRARSEGRYVYTVLLTSRDRPEDTVAGLSVGADDYLIKPIASAELIARVRAGQRVRELEAQLLAARSELEYKATHDPLTRTLNREEALNALEVEVERAIRSDEWLSVVMLDLDRFKRVNDDYGHPVGDEVLSEAGRRLASNLRAYDLIGRYGGEEFLVVLPGCGATQGMRIAERLREVVAGQPVPTTAGAVTVTVSLGVTSDHGAYLDADALVSAADRALYRAKQAGRNRVETGARRHLDAA